MFNSYYALSPAKGLWIFVILKLFTWKAVSWGVYDNLNEGDFEAVTKQGSKALLIHQEKISDNEQSAIEEIDIQEPRLALLDAVVRLGSYTVVDNAIHVLWLRFRYPHNGGKPYTTYFNTSELWTLILGAEVLLRIALRFEDMRHRKAEPEVLPDKIAL